MKGVDDALAPLPRLRGTCLATSLPPPPPPPSPPAASSPPSMAPRCEGGNGATRGAARGVSFQASRELQPNPDAGVDISGDGIPSPTPPVTLRRARSGESAEATLIRAPCRTSSAMTAVWSCSVATASAVYGGTPFAATCPALHPPASSAATAPASPTAAATTSGCESCMRAIAHALGAAASRNGTSTSSPRRTASRAPRQRVPSAPPQPPPPPHPILTPRSPATVIAVSPHGDSARGSAPSRSRPRTLSLSPSAAAAMSGEHPNWM